MGVRNRMIGVLLSCLVAGTAGVAVPPPNLAVSEAGVCERVHRLKPEYALGSGPRLTFVLASGYGQSRVTITSCLRGPLGYAQQWQTPGFAGSAGFAAPGPVYTNSLQTPTGSYSVSEAFGRSNPGTTLPYRQLKESSYWGGRPGPDFNHYFEGEGRFPDEPLWRYMQEGDYEQAAVINYNRPPDMEAVHGRTFAIFLHAGMSETWGCISTDLATVNEFLGSSRVGDRIIMGVESELFREVNQDPI